MKSRVLLVVIAVLIVSLVAASVFLIAQSSDPKQVEITGTVTMPSGDRLIGVGWSGVYPDSCGFPPCHGLSNGPSDSITCAGNGTSCSWLSNASNTYSITVPNNEEYGLGVFYYPAPKTLYSQFSVGYIVVNATSSSDSVITYNINCTSTTPPSPTSPLGQYYCYPSSPVNDPARLK